MGKRSRSQRIGSMPAMGPKPPSRLDVIVRHAEAAVYGAGLAHRWASRALWLALAGVILGLVNMGVLAWQLLR